MSAARPPHYPVMLDVAGRLAVVIGATRAAVRAATSLAKHGANVVIVTPQVSTQLMDLESEGVLTIEPRGYVRGDLAKAMIAVVATGSPETDAAVVEEAREHNVLVNVLADGSKSNFIIPSVVRRGDLQIAVSTAGKAPSVARQVKRDIARAHGEEWARYVELVAEVRALAFARTGMTDAELAPLFDHIRESDLLYRLHGGEEVAAETLYDEFIAAAATPPEPKPEPEPMEDTPS